MNGLRAKRLRKVVAGLDKPDAPHYSDIKFWRKRRKYAEDGTFTLVNHYQVRTLFLTKCKRAVYLRLKRSPREFQDNLLKLV